MNVAVTDLLAWWSGYYSDHAAVAGTIRYLHLAGIVVGGGTALAADRLVLAARSTPAGKERILATLAEAHRIVLPCLAAVAITGALMVAADAATFLASRTYAVKMAGVGLLVANGGALRYAEREIRKTGTARAWVRLAIAARLSTGLWLLVLMLGVLLTFAA